MKIWLLENGERTGPHEVYDIRDRISDDELHADTPAWYEGAEDWVTLGDVATYSSYFKRPASAETLREEEKLTSELIDSLERGLTNADSKPDSAAFQNEPLEPVRRFFARVFDIFIYSILLWIIKAQIGINPFIFEGVIKGLIDYLPYILLDGLALTYFGSTPGKWLLNIRLRSHDGKLLDIQTSLIRSVRVWVLGFALGSIFAVVSLPFSWFVASKYGKFLWDIPKNNVTHCEELTRTKLLVYIALIITAFYCLINFIPLEMIPPEYLEDWKKALEAGK